jgi:hypothetical protein
LSQRSTNSVEAGRGLASTAAAARPRSRLPAPAETREHDGIPFDIFQVEGPTLVFWPEGDVLCVLVSDGEADALIQLAFAKAMRARAHGV